MTLHKVVSGHSPINIVFTPIVLVIHKEKNPAYTWIVLALRKSWDNMTCPKNHPWVNKTKHILVCQGPEANLAQSM
jgi:hypothetical protein